MSDTLSAAAIATGQEDKIRQRAYELWENEGRAGSPEDHWLRAERELFDQEPERSDATGRVPHPLPQLRSILPRPARSLMSGLPTSR
jgi:hypothetical protein